MLSFYKSEILIENSQSLSTQIIYNLSVVPSVCLHKFNEGLNYVIQYSDQKTGDMGRIC